MNIFGYTITRRVKATAQTDEVVLSGKTYQHQWVPMSSIYESVDNPFLNAICWPEPPTDEFERLRYDKVVLSFYESSLSGVRRFFSICPIDELITLLKIGNNNCLDRYEGFCMESYNKLRMLHCIKYNNMPPTIVEQIPELMNRVFGTDRAIQPVQQALECDT